MLVGADAGVGVLGGVVIVQGDVGVVIVGHFWLSSAYFNRHRLSPATKERPGGVWPR
jgi:hypothetical protein